MSASSSAAAAAIRETRAHRRRWPSARQLARARLFARSTRAPAFSFRQTKNFDTVEAACKHYTKTEAEKRKKGYADAADPEA